MNTLYERICTEELLVYHYVRDPTGRDAFSVRIHPSSDPEENKHVQAWVGNLAVMHYRPCQHTDGLWYPYMLGKRISHNGFPTIYLALQFLEQHRWNIDGRTGGKNHP